MKYTELLKQPNGIVFYENDLPAPALLQKVESVESDIVVRQLDAEFEQSRFGFREMDEVELNSKDFHVFSLDELATLNEFLTLAYLQN